MFARRRASPVSGARPAGGGRKCPEPHRPHGLRSVTHPSFPRGPARHFLQPVNRGVTSPTTPTRLHSPSGGGRGAYGPLPGREPLATPATDSGRSWRGKVAGCARRSDRRGVSDRSAQESPAWPVAFLAPLHSRRHRRERGWHHLPMSRAEIVSAFRAPARSRVADTHSVPASTGYTDGMP